MNFDENLEKSLERLGERIERGRTVAETEASPEREIVKRSIQSLSQNLPKEDGEKKEEKAETGGSVLPGYLRDDDGGGKAKEEVEGLLGLVFEKGLEPALKEAKGHSPFIEDAFHDALVDKLLPELKKRGIIK